MMGREEVVKSSEDGLGVPRGCLVVFAVYAVCLGLFFLLKAFA